MQDSCFQTIETYMKGDIPMMHLLGQVNTSIKIIFANLKHLINDEEGDLMAQKGIVIAATAVAALALIALLVKVAQAFNDAQGWF